MKISLKEIIENSLDKAITYKEYRDLIDDLVVREATIGQNQSQEMVRYTALNQRRYKRLDKTLKLSERDIKFFSEFPKKIIFLIITELWCGDAAQIVPVLNKITEVGDMISSRLVFRDENDELMQCFLTNGAKSIPKLIILDFDTKEVIADWGPRPSIATKMVAACKEEYGILTPECKEDLQRWYNDDKGRCVIDDLKQVLSSIQ